MFARRLRRLTAALLLAAGAAACAGGGEPAAHQEPLAFPDHPPVDLHLRVPAGRDVSRYVSAVHAVLQRLGEWFGPLPSRAITVIDPGWPGATPRVHGDDVIVVAVPWPSPVRGGTLEAVMARALATHFWQRAAPPGAAASLVDGLALYAAARILDSQFPGAHAVERRYAAGLVPFVVRSVPIEGPDAQLSRLEGSADARRAARALFTLERLVGWATMQQALATYARAPASPGDAGRDLFAILQVVSGRDLAWFVDAAFHGRDEFDYAIDALDTGPAPDRAGRYHTTVGVRRAGRAVFSGSGRAAEGAFRSPGPVEVLVVFEDGHEMRERWDGRDERIVFEYESRSPAVSAAVDPDRVLLLDENRANNRRTVAGASAAAAAWAARWAVWLEDAMVAF